MIIVNTSSLKIRGEMFDQFMAKDKFDSSSNVNVCSIIRINTDIAQIQDVLALISNELSTSYLYNVTGVLRYEFAPDKSKLSLFVWGRPEFTENIIRAVHCAQKKWTSSKRG